ncbi:MAG TPA: SURF1 family protein [Dehalococcoidia bacterium]|nr:SURF1 family protein [Dehalococcoidia bacterium]
MTATPPTDAPASLQLRPALMLPLVAIAVVTFVGLGLWQITRMNDKRDLEQQLGDRIAAEPLTASAATRLPLDDLDYRRVVLDGRWDFDAALTIRGRFRFGISGEEIIVPLLPAGGGDAILVNRGWYPTTEREATRATLAAENASNIEGLIRYFASGSANETSPGVWTRFHPRSLAGSLSYGAQPWGVVEGQLVERQPLTPPGTLPAQDYVAFDDTVTHLEYALTWFGLAIALAVTATIRLRTSRAPLAHPPGGGV